MSKTISIANIEAKRYSYIPFSEEFRQAFGNREKTGNWIVYGKAGHGKTRFMLELAKEFDRMGYKVLVASLEMGFCADFQNDLIDSGIRSKTRNRKRKTRYHAKNSRQKSFHLFHFYSPFILCINDLPTGQG